MFLNKKVFSMLTHYKVRLQIALNDMCFDTDGSKWPNIMTVFFVLEQRVCRDGSSDHSDTLYGILECSK